MDIIVDKLTKKRKDQILLDNISFKASGGKVFGILGPKGAQKTVLIRTLMGITKPDSGTITFDGKPVNSKIRDKIGYLPERRGIFQRQKVIDVLIYFGRLKNLSSRKTQIEAIRLLDRYKMIDSMEKSIDHLSEELQEKLQILVTIIHNPEILILDEPFQRFYPLNQDVIRKLIYKFREEEKTVVISTYQFNEAEKLCDDILFINKGRIVLKGNLDKLREKFQSHLILVEADDNLGSLRRITGVKKIFIEKQSAKLFVDYKIPPKEILQNIISTINVSRIEITRPNLDDIFFDVINSEEET
jgi:ABC-2 type transport system ATP-binding protein